MERLLNAVVTFFIFVFAASLADSSLLTGKEQVLTFDCPSDLDRTVILWFIEISDFSIDLLCALLAFV